MTDFQAALGISQLKKLPSFLARRREIARLYREAFEPLGLLLPEAPPDRDHIYYRYILQLEGVDDFMREMEQRGIECRRPVFIPLHRYLALEGYPSTEEAWKRSVSIPIYPSLKDEEARDIVDKVKELL